MTYDAKLFDRLLGITAEWEDIEAKKMFGGICLLIKGNMFSGIYRDDLILRLGEPGAREALGKPHVKPFDITGRPMKGWVMVEAPGFDGDPGLRDWLTKARSFALTLASK